MSSFKYSLGSHLAIFQWVLQGPDVAFENHIIRIVFWLTHFLFCHSVHLKFVQQKKGL